MNVRTWLRGAGVALATCTGLAGIAAAQPANDLCANATDITAGPFPLVTGNVNIGTATNDSIAAALPSGVLRPECESSSAPNGTLNRGVWWKIAVGASNVRLTTSETSSTDVLITIYKSTDGTCGTLAYQFCVDTSETNSPFNLEANGVYYIATSRWGTTVPTDPTNVNMTFNVEAATAAPTNNSCATAFALTGPSGSDARDIGGAINSVPPATCQTTGSSSAGGSAYFPIWYSYTTGPTNEGFVFTENSSEDVVVTFFTGTCGSLTQVSCVDGGSGTTETGSINLSGSTSYLIRVSRKSQAAAVALSLPINFGWSITTPPAAPANATCAAATVISSVPFTSGAIQIAGSPADASINPSCDSTSNPASAANPVWFAFTPSATGPYQFLETVSGTDVVATIWTGACGGGQTQVVCDDSAVDGTAGLVRILDAGTPYYIAISRFSATAGSFADTVNLTVNAISPPPNDTCATAITVTIPGSSYSQTAVDVRGAGPDIDVSCNSTSATQTLNGIWHTFTPVAGDTYTVTVAETGSEDTSRAVFTGSCGTLTQIACADAESLTFAATGGTTYYVLTGQFSATTAATSTYTVTISSTTVSSACCTATACTIIGNNACTAAGGIWHGPNSTTCSVATNAANACQPPPANDTCATATAISGSLPQTFSTPFPAAAGDDLDTTCNSTTLSQVATTRFGVWYSYTTGADAGVLNYSETGSIDVALTVFSGTCSGLTQVVCTDAETAVTATLQANTTYYILVGTFSNTTTPASAYTFVANSFTAVTGACCNITTCSITTASACSGLFLGANSTCAAVSPNRDAPATPVALNDASEATTPGTYGTTTRTISSTQSGTISTVAVNLSINHTWAGDLRIRLTSPGGVSSILANRPVATAPQTCITDFTTGGKNADLSGTYTFSDAGATGWSDAVTAASTTTGTFVPSGSYRAQNCDGTLIALNTVFAGETIAGTWTLEIVDADAGDTGNFISWELVANNVTVGPCDNVGSCCVGSSCSLVANSAACSGTYTAGGACSPNPCVSANVVCCRGTVCSLVSAASCTAPAGVGVSQSAGASCNAGGNNTSPCCYSDFNKDGTRNIDDIFIYLNAWFGSASSPFTKIGGDGTTPANIDDLFVFINVWFAGGCG
jgi:subtilisin-like proprotein convertase family protein